VYKVGNDGVQVSEIEYMLAREIELLLVVFLQCNLSQKYLSPSYVNKKYITYCIILDIGIFDNF
jgi:hypothetical protein